VHFYISIYCGGTTEKVSQFSMPIMSVYNKILCLNEQKCIFEHGRKIKPIKYFHNCIINVLQFPLFSFSVLPSLSSCLYYIKMCCSIVKNNKNYFYLNICGRFVEQKLLLYFSFKCDQIYNFHYMILVTLCGPTNVHCIILYSEYN
jgi:hypothetical protein